MNKTENTLIITATEKKSEHLKSYLKIKVSCLPLIGASSMPDYKRNICGHGKWSHFLQPEFHRARDGAAELIGSAFTKEAGFRQTPGSEKLRFSLQSERITECMTYTCPCIWLNTMVV